MSLSCLKEKIKEKQEILKKSPDVVWSNLSGYTKNLILLDDLKMNKDSLKAYAKNLGLQFIADLELKDFSPDVAQDIAKVMRNKIEEEIRQLEKIHNTVLGLEDEIEKLVLKLKEGRCSPFEMQGKMYKGDVFYSWVYSAVKERFGKMDRMKESVIYGEIVARLEKDGYYVHS